MSEVGTSTILIVRVAQAPVTVIPGWTSGPAPLPLPQGEAETRSYIYKQRADLGTRAEFMREQVTPFSMARHLMSCVRTWSWTTSTF